MDFTEGGWEGVDWMHLALDGWRLIAGSWKHSNEYSGSIKCEYFLTRWVTISFSRRALLYGIN